MTLTHRPAKENDIPLICTFPKNHDELFFIAPKVSYPLNPQLFKEAITQRSDPTVVELDGKVVGFANFYRWKIGGSCYIGNVIIAPFARGDGAGQYLMERMINIAFSKHQAIEVIISCFNQNIAGLLFYSKLGFNPYEIEERKDKQENRVALIHMRLRKSLIC
jgi:ribosomal protein S18 acetylase RimI-like enzyme